MTNIAPAAAAEKPPRTVPHALRHREQLHELARRVERLGVAGRTDPEAILIAKFSIGAELRRLARELGP